MTIKYQIERQCYKDHKKRHTKFEPTFYYKKERVVTGV